MTTWEVPQFKPSLGEREALAAAECVRSGWITEGPRCEEFVERIKAIAGVQYGVLAPNGTLALYLALKACGVDEGWEVVVPDLTFVATATAVVMAGAQPIFADVDEYGQMDWSRGGRTGWSGVEPAHARLMYLPVHLYGAACPVKVPKQFVIEDACQALGVSMDGRPCGSFGRASAFSFFADKTITTGEGGFVGTDDPLVFERLRYLRNQGRISRGSFVHACVGQNFRMTDVQAAIGLEQLDRMDAIVRAKQTIYQEYRAGLGALPGIRLLGPTPGSAHIPFRAVVLFDQPASAAADFLKGHGIEPRSAFYPLHRQPCFAYMRCDSAAFPRADYFWEHALCLPTWPDMGQGAIALVCETIKEFVAESEKAS